MEKSKKPAIRFKGFTDDWEQRKLGELGTITTGSTPSTSIPDYYSDDGIVWVTPTDICENITFESARKLSDLGQQAGRVVPKNTILVTCIASIGKNTMLGNTGSFNQQINGLTPNENECDPYFLLTESALWSAKMKSSAAAGTMQIVNRTEFSELKTWLPSLIEQQAISDFFRQLDNLITLHQRKCDKLVNMKKAMLEKMFPKNGDKVPEIRFKGFTDDWEQRKVFDIANRFDNLRVPVAANLRVPGTTPYYGANGIQDYVDGFTHNGEFVLVAEDGANDLKNYPVKFVNGRIWVNNHAHVLQAKPEIANNKYIAYSISQADIESLLVGGSRAKLNAEIMMGIEFYIPSLPEQEAIGRFFELLDNLITLHQRKIKKIKNIKKAMLEKMFV